MTYLIPCLSGANKLKQNWFICTNCLFNWLKIQLVHWPPSLWEDKGSWAHIVVNWGSYILICLTQSMLSQAGQSTEGACQTLSEFADGIFKRIFLNENFCILIWISLTFLPKGPIENNSSLDQVMTCCHAGNKTILEPMVIQLIDVQTWEWPLDYTQ